MIVYIEEFLLVFIIIMMISIFLGVIIVLGSCIIHLLCYDPKQNKHELNEILIVKH
jgi:hypothetical protein